MGEKAIRIIKEYLSGKYGIDTEPFIVWQCKTLQNWKFILSASLPTGHLYELTYNGDKSEWYLDDYVKELNTVIKEER